MLTFEEACEYRTLQGIRNDDDFFYDYLKWGGFPQRFDLPGESRRLYLFESACSIIFVEIFPQL
jgi:uncharacterized protein